MSQKRVYTVRFTAQTLTAARPFVFVNPKTSGAGAALEIISIRLGQSGSTTSAMERVEIWTQASAFPSGGTSVTPVPTNFGDPASGITGGTAGAAGNIGVAYSTAGAGTQTAILDDSFNVLNGWLYIPVPEERLTIGIAGTAQGLAVGFPSGPATLTNWNMTFTYAELI
jgi:hypothetical protein